MQADTTDKPLTITKKQVYEAYKFSLVRSKKKAGAEAGQVGEAGPYRHLLVRVDKPVGVVGASASETYRGDMGPAWLWADHLEPTASAVASLAAHDYLETDRPTTIRIFTAALDEPYFDPQHHRAIATASVAIRSRVFSAYRP